MNENAKKVIEACEANFEEFKSDCSGFVKAVVRSVANTTLQGTADDIVDFLNHTNGWTVLSDGDGQAAKEKADNGWIVVGGMMNTELTPIRSHGHVVIVVTGDLDPGHKKYPTAFWGMFGGVGAKNKSLNFSFNRTDRDKVHYYALEV
ncbi:MAG: hypothetical protein JWQ09_4890 [Segetibacter sp.]|nr:hypothetical protein [Segetibacter sp.]